MPKLAIYTAAFGDHDKPAELPGLQGVVDLFCFTDSPDLKLDTWQIFRRPNVFRTPRMDAKWYKMSACHLMPQHEVSIYLDASIRVKDPSLMIAEVGRALSRDARGELAFFLHPEEQRSLEQEAAFSMTMPKYQGEPCVRKSSTTETRACRLLIPATIYMRAASSDDGTTQRSSASRSAGSMNACTGPAKTS